MQASDSHQFWLSLYWCISEHFLFLFRYFPGQVRLSRKFFGAHVYNQFLWNWRGKARLVVVSWLPELNSIISTQIRCRGPLFICVVVGCSLLPWLATVQTALSKFWSPLHWNMPCHWVLSFWKHLTACCTNSQVPSLSVYNSASVDI